MEGPQEELSDVATEAARKHGKLRYQQGYTIPQILREARVLQHVLTATIHENLFGLDLSTLVGDILEIGETLQADAEISIRVYQSQIPRSLQTSFSLLYQSPYLGVAIADEHRIIDGNDAFLRMIGQTRAKLAEGKIDWRAMTPEKISRTRCERHGAASRIWYLCPLRKRIPVARWFFRAISHRSRAP